jgi:hypothetical protein
MSLTTIFNEITVERARQDLLHPIIAKYLLHPTVDPQRSQILESLINMQGENDRLEEINEASWYGVLYEEMKEIFSADNTKDLYHETIQTIAVLVRMLQSIKDGDIVI